MRTKTTLAQKVTAEYESKIKAFHKFGITARRKYNFEIKQIVNIDKVPLTLNVS